MSYTIYYDAYQEAEWFRGLSPHLSGAKLKPINESIEPSLVSLLRYDKPDIILYEDQTPRLSLEKTSEVPTGHNVGQRFGRIVCAAEEGVLGIYFGPFLAKKHGKYASKCWINVRQLEAMLKLHGFHNVPSLAVNWQCDADAELIHNGSESAKLAELINELIKSGWNYDIPEVQQIEKDMCEEITEGIKRHAGYGSPPNSAKIIKTEIYLLDPRLKDYKFPEFFTNRSESLHYVVGMKAGLRSDPFTGTQLLYDYLYCRTGPTKTERSRNLVMEIPDLSLSDWNAVTNTERKDKRLLVMFPDILILKDGYAKTS